MEADFDKLYAEKFQVIKAFAWKYVHNEQDAEDVAQQTFLAYYKHADNIRKPEPFLFQIAKNTAITLYRKKKSRKEVSSGYLENVSSTEGVSPWIHELPLSPELKLFTQGYEYKEISELLGIPIGTVSRRIFYERKALKEKVPQ